MTSTLLEVITLPVSDVDRALSLLRRAGRLHA
jgi:hypothetical protein